MRIIILISMIILNCGAFMKPAFLINPVNDDVFSVKLNETYIDKYSGCWIKTLNKNPVKISRVVVTDGVGMQTVSDTIYVNPDNSFYLAKCFYMHNSHILDRQYELQIDIVYEYDGKLFSKYRKVKYRTGL